MSRTTKPAKVFYLIERLARAGTELHALKLIERIDRSRFEPVLCCLNSRDTDKSLLPTGTTHHLLNGGWNLMRPLTVGLFYNVRRLIRQEQPSIVHTFLFISNVMGPVAARLEKVPVVLTTRGRMGIEWQAHALHRACARFAGKRVDRLIVKTRAMGREIEQVERIPWEKMEIIPNGVDVEYFRPPYCGKSLLRRMLYEQHGIPVEGPLLLAIGNLKPIKNHATLVKACERVRETLPMFQGVVVGEGESRNDLNDAVNSSGLRNLIHFPGRSDDVRPWLQAADLFVAPSLSEGMPNAVLEAMASGLPMILSNVDGHTETAPDSAWFFDPQNPEELASRIIEGVHSPEEMSKRSRILREHAIRHFSMDSIVRRVENVYCDALKSKGIIVS